MPFGEFLQPLVDGHGFSVAGRQLATARHWGAGVFDRGGWGGMWGLNPRLPEPQSGALPTELIPPQGTSLWYQGGASGANARDNDLAKRWSVPPMPTSHSADWRTGDRPPARPPEAGGTTNTR